MKICPTCQASFPDLLRSCPDHPEVILMSQAEMNDQPPPGFKNNPPAVNLSFSVPEPGSLITRLSAALQHFVRDFGRRVPPLRSDATGGFQFLLRDEPLLARLKRELIIAAQDFKHDPRGFLTEVWRGEGSNQRRRRLLHAGVAVAMIAYAFLFTTFLLAGLIKFASPQVSAKLSPPPNPDPMPGVVVRLKVDKPLKGVPQGTGGFTGGSQPRIQQAHGGGGGGDHRLAPANRGVPPRRTFEQQVRTPDPELPKINHASLLKEMTVMVDPKALPDLKGSIGDLRGTEGPPSRGPGDEAGIGNGKGTGVGPGNGPGVGPGFGGNTGGDKMGIGGGPRGPGCCGEPPPAGTQGTGKPTIIYRERAKYTEEARQNKIMGTVVLSAIFSADGRITGIRVLSSLQNGLTEKAVEAAQKIRFKPATKNGEPVSVRMQLEYNFTIY